MLRSINGLTIRYMKRNRLRNIMTILCITISIILLLVTGLFVVSGYHTLQKYEFINYGHHDGFIKDIPPDRIPLLKNHVEIKECGISGLQGYTLGRAFKPGEEPYHQTSHRFIEVRAFDEKSMDLNGFRLSEGRLPTSPDEVVADPKTLSYLNNSVQVGDLLEISLYHENPMEQNLTTATKQTYRLVGLLVPDRWLTDREIGILATGYGGADDKLTDYNLIFTIDSPWNVYTDVYRLAQEAGITEGVFVNEYYRYNINVQSLFILSVLFLFLFAIIVVTTFVAIKSTIDINMQERQKEMGLLKALGATKRQLRRLLRQELSLIWIFSLIPGLLIGFLISLGLMNLVNQRYIRHFLLQPMEIHHAPLIMLLVSAVTLLLIYAAAHPSDRRLRDLKPVHSFRNPERYYRSRKSMKNYPITKYLFGFQGYMVRKQIRMNGRKFFMTIGSIAIALVLFVSSVMVIQEGKYAIQQNTDRFSDVSFALFSEDFGQEKLEQVLQIDGVASVSRMEFLYLPILETVDLLPENFKKRMEPLAGDSKTIVLENSSLIVLEDELYQKTFEIDDTSYQQMIKENAGMLVSSPAIEDLGYTKGSPIFFIDEDHTYEFQVFEHRLESMKQGFDFLHNTFRGNYAGNYLFFIPYAVANQNLDPGTMARYELYFDIMIEDLEDPERIETAFKEIETDSEIYGFRFPKKEQTQMTRWVRLIAMILYGFSAFIALISAIHIVNVLTSNIEKRKKEWALLKAMGMEKRQLKRMVLSEAYLYATYASILGMVMILGSMVFVQQFLFGMIFREGFNQTFGISMLSTLIGILVIYTIAGVSGHLALRKIDRVHVMTNLKEE